MEKKVTSGMGLANILSNVTSTASTGLDINIMEFVRNTKGDTIMIGLIMLAIATLLAINHKEHQSLKD